MIAKLRGKVDTIGDDFCIVDVNGVGYLVFASAKSLGKLKIGAEASLLIETVVRSDRDGDTENEERKKDTADADEVKKNVTDESGKTDAAAEWMELYLDQHTDSGNQKAIEIGEKARLSVLWKLADAYERSGMKTEQIQTYGQLIEWEQDPIQLEEAGVRKMKLEAAQGDYKQAAETGKKVLERIEASEKITKMLKGYELYKGEEGES